MTSSNSASRPMVEHICTFPTLETQLRGLGISLITYRYVDGDPRGVVDEIEFFDSFGARLEDAVTDDLRATVHACIERDALQFLCGRWVDCEARRIRWAL